MTTQVIFKIDKKLKDIRNDFEIKYDKEVS